MKIFITGAAGYVGGAIVGELARAGHEVHALVRREEQAGSVRSLGACAELGDLAEPARYAELAAACDAIVHLASPAGVEAARFALDSLLEAARGGRVRHFLSTSVPFVLGDRPGGADEGSPCSEEHYVDRSALERQVLAAHDERLACAVIRPGMVYGGGDGGTVSEMLAGALARRVEYVGDGANRWPLVHRDDVAALFRLVLDERASGVFHATDGAPMRVSELAACIAALTGAAVASVSLDAARAELGRFADALCLDQPIESRRSRELGWRPAWPSFAERAHLALAELVQSRARSCVRKAST